jgi:hypothetical protein
MEPHVGIGRARKGEKLVDDLVQGFDLVSDPTQDPVSLRVFVGLLGRRSEELQSTEWVADLVRHLGQHQTELLVPPEDAETHALHGSRQPSDLVTTLLVDRLRPSPALDSERRATESLERNHDVTGQNNGQKDREHTRTHRGLEDSAAQYGQWPQVIGAHLNGEDHVSPLTDRHEAVLVLLVADLEEGRGRREPGRGGLFDLVTVRLEIRERCADRDLRRGPRGHESREVAGTENPGGSDVALQVGELAVGAPPQRQALVTRQERAVRRALEAYGGGGAGDLAELVVHLVFERRAGDSPSHPTAHGREEQGEREERESELTAEGHRIRPPTRRGPFPRPSRGKPWAAP